MENKSLYNSSSKKKSYTGIVIAFLLLILCVWLLVVLLINNKEEYKNDEEIISVSKFDLPTLEGSLPAGVEIVSNRRIGEAIVFEVKNVSSNDLYIEAKVSFYVESNKKILENDMGESVKSGGTTYLVVYDILQGMYEKCTYVIKVSEEELFESIDVSGFSHSEKEKDKELVVTVKNESGMEAEVIDVCVIWYQDSEEVDIRCDSLFSLDNNDKDHVELFYLGDSSRKIPKDYKVIINSACARNS